MAAVRIGRGNLSRYVADVRIGRLLVASLHQAVSECLPTRLDFYEHWLDTRKLRTEGVGRAQLSAVFSFLRRENGHHDTVTALAGRYTATWSLGTWSGVRRGLVNGAPRFVRRRLVTRAAARTLRRLGVARRLRIRRRDGALVVEIDDSIFCDPRAKPTAGLCRFVTAAFEAFLEAFDMPSTTTIVGCRAVEGERCVLRIEPKPR